MTNIDNFLTCQVENGSCASLLEAEQELLSILLTREVDKGIEKGLDDIKNGRFRVLTNETNSEFIASLVKKILPDTHK